MSFQPTISNEQTSALPSAHFDGEIMVIDREEQIERACRDLASQKIIGFDTETRPSFKAGVTNKVALLQLSTHDRCYLIRLCRTKLHNSILKILSNPKIIKIGADVAGDIRSLHVLRNFKERGFIDLQQIAPRWGIEEKSLRKLAAIVLGHRVSKAQRLSNWEAYSLTPQQQMYAATDAWVCITLYEALMAAEPTNPKVEIKPYAAEPTERVNLKRRMTPRKETHRPTRHTTQQKQTESKK
ncbi:MAG: 3'-5' exonuclease domain-containing protein 2 [Alistipes sp.]|nr:3'-5' exonuclease domain-containing protein 2 [Alistipes sp.]